MKIKIFKGEHVLVIGASSSGLDLVNHLANVAKSVTLSQNKLQHQTKEARERRKKSLPAGTILKDNVKRFTADGAEFIDGTTQPFTVIIYATGESDLFNFFFFVFFRNDDCRIMITLIIMIIYYKFVFSLA